MTTHYETLPPLAFDPGDTANLGCILQHAERDQHTLVIDRDEASSEADEYVNLTVIFDGLPGADITVDRRELLAALGVSV